MDVHKLLAITEELIAFLTHEQKVLKEHKLIEAEKMHGEKDRLNGEYQLAVQKIKSDRSYMNSLSEQIRDQVRNKTLQMKTLMDENEKMISIAAEANRHILLALVAKFAKSMPAISSYTALGACSQTKQTRVASLTVNTCI
jgi:hypothetical protein